MNKTARFQALYARIPDVPCQGLCQGSCGVIPATKWEKSRVLEGLPVVAEHGDPTVCPVLSEEGRCSNYEHRPVICRLFGAAEGIECLFGCRPERLLTKDEAGAIIDEAARIGGEMDILNNEMLEVMLKEKRCQAPATPAA